MAFIAPKFRRESWYGRLFLRAYGNDRGWLVRLRRMTSWTWFGYAPYPTLTADMPEAEQLMTLLNWSNGRERAYERALAILSCPPPVQPFVEDGPKVSICPTFWKIVFALFTYCPIVAACAIGRMIRDAVVATGSAIASAFRWVGQRYGRPIAYASGGAFLLAGYAAFLWCMAWASYGITGAIMGRQGISPNEAFLQAREAQQKQWRAQRREEIRQEFLTECTSYIRQGLEYRKSDEWARGPDLFGPHWRRGELSHEAYARLCMGRDESSITAIERLEAGEFRCAIDGGWHRQGFEDHFPSEAERKTLAAWLGKELRKRFADELKIEIAARERRLAEARKRDAAVIGATTVALLPLQQNPAEFYRRFQEFCAYNEYAKTWEMRRWSSGDEMTNATCATLAGLFREQIADAQSAITWQGRRAALKKHGPYVGAVLGSVITGVFLLALLIVLLDKYGQPFIRALGWCFHWVLFTATWACIIAFAPIWVPARFLVYPALKLIGRAWMLVWKSPPVAYVRHAFDAVFTGIVAGIRRFFAAIAQIWQDTWHLIRAFASARWHQLCPFIEWN
jgi:hypothetical protein